MTSKLSGVITDIFRPEFIGNFTKRVFWLKQSDRERYPQHWSVELWGEDCKELERYQIGDEVDVDVEIRGKYWQKGDRESVFNTLKVIGMKKAGQTRIPDFIDKTPPTLGDDLPF